MRNPPPDWPAKQVTYCGLQLACGGLLAVAYGAARLATRYLLLVSAAAGLSTVAALLLLLQPRGGASRLRAAAAANLLLAALFAAATALLVADAGGGTCALNGGMLPAGPFALRLRARDGPAVIPMASTSMVSAPWSLCITVDVLIAAGGARTRWPGPGWGWGWGGLRLSGLAWSTAGTITGACARPGTQLSRARADARVADRSAL